MRASRRIGTAIVAAGVIAMAAAAAEKEAPVGRVQRASQLIFKPGATTDAVREGFVLLLEAAADAAADARMPEAFTSKVVEARRIIRDVALVDAKATLLLQECHGELHGGTPFRMPAGLKTPADVAAHYRGLLDGVPGLLKAGKPRDALSRMLEAAVAVMTPIEQP